MHKITRRYIWSRLFRLAVTVCWRALTASRRQKDKRGLSSGHSHYKTAFESFAPDISEQPDPTLTDLFDTRNHGSQRLSASYQHTRHVVVTHTHAHTTRDRVTEVLTIISGEVCAELPRLFLCERPSSIAPRWVKGGRQELECTQSEKESVQLLAVHYCCGANRGRIVSLQSRYSSPFINLRAVLNQQFFSKNIQSSKYLEPVRRRSSKCFSNIWNEVGPEKLRLVASKFWSLFRPFQSTHVRAATAEPRASLTTQSQLRSWLRHRRP